MKATADFMMAINEFDVVGGHSSRSLRLANFTD
jgi:hypothetical protein